MSELGEIFTIIFVLIGLAIFSYIVCYVVKAITIYQLAKRANKKYPWMAFIPVVQNAKIYNFAGFSDLFYFIVLGIGIVSPYIPLPGLVAIIGILQAILNIYVRWLTAKSFGSNTAMCILNIFFEPFVLLYFMLTKQKYKLYPMNESLHELLEDYHLVETENFED